MKRLLRVLDSSGDSRHSFDLESTDGLADARRVFDEQIKKGSSAFSTTPGSSEPSKRIEKLEDASGTEVLIVPAITAG